MKIKNIVFSAIAVGLIIIILAAFLFWYKAQVDLKAEDTDVEINGIMLYESYVKGDFLGSVTLNGMQHPILYANNSIKVCDTITRQWVIDSFALSGELASYKVLKYYEFQKEDTIARILTITKNKDSRVFQMIGLMREKKEDKIIFEKLFETKTDAEKIVDVIINDRKLERIVCQTQDKKTLLFHNEKGGIVFKHSFDKSTLYSHINSGSDNISCYDGSNLMFFTIAKDKLISKETIKLENTAVIDNVLWSYNSKYVDNVTDSYLYDGTTVITYDEISAKIIYRYKTKDLISIMGEHMYIYNDRLVFFDVFYPMKGLIIKRLEDKPMKPAAMTYSHPDQGYTYFLSDEHKRISIYNTCYSYSNNTLRRWGLKNVYGDILSFDESSGFYLLYLFDENAVYLVDLNNFFAKNREKGRPIKLID